MSHDFKECKVCAASSCRARYQLSGPRGDGSSIWVCENCGAHHLDYLDPADAFQPFDLETELNPDAAASQDYDSRGRHQTHFKMIAALRDLSQTRALDVGCGAGYFLSLLEQAGAEACGLEVDETPFRHARARGHTVHPYPIEHEFWQSGEIGQFDLITMWDVIEHLNSPRATLAVLVELLRPGGLLICSTPCRNAFYYRAGRMTYALSGGRYPTFLNLLYSNRLFGHKQILSTGDLSRLYRDVGLEVESSSKIHELSLPYRNYIKKALGSQRAANLLHPLASLFFSVVPIQNKMIVVGKKPD